MYDFFSALVTFCKGSVLLGESKRKLCAPIPVPDFYMPNYFHFNVIRICQVLLFILKVT